MNDTYTYMIHMYFLYYVKLLAAKCQLEYTSLIIFHFKENVHFCKQTINRME